MRKLILLVVFLLSITVVEAATAVSVSWQLSSDILKPSSIATISLTISNPGVDLNNVVINSTSGPYVTITSGGKINLGGIASGQSTQAALSIKVSDDAPSTNSYVNLVVDYYTSTSNYEKTFSIPLTIIREPILQIQNVNFSRSLEPGVTSVLSFDLTNEGMGDAKDVIVSLEQTPSFIVSSSSGEFFINTISESASQKFSIPLTVSPDATIGTTNIPVKITYSDETRTNNYTDNQQIGALITGNYNFIVTVDSQDVMAAGTTGTATIKIANGGDQQAFHLTVNVVKSNNFDITPTVIYVGNLNSDDYDSEKLTLNVGSINPGFYPINLNISYDDSFGNTYNEIYSANVKISSKSEYATANQTQSPLATLLIVIVIIIIFFIAYRKGYLNKLFKRK